MIFLKKEGSEIFYIYYYYSCNLKGNIKMKKPMYLYPVWVRLWHLANAILFLALTVTGLSLQYSSNEYALIPFNYAVSIHNISGIILCVGYVFYLLANRFTSNGNYYQFHLKGLLGRISKQFMYYSFGIFKKEDPPFPVSQARFRQNWVAFSSSSPRPRGDQASP